MDVVEQRLKERRIFLIHSFETLPNLNRLTVLYKCGTTRYMVESIYQFLVQFI